MIPTWSPVVLCLLASSIDAFGAGGNNDKVFLGTYSVSEAQAKLQTTCDEYSARTGIGVTAAVKVGDQMIQAAAGNAVNADGEQEAVPMTVDTVTSFGSITKTFVSASVMRAVEEEKLALDDPARMYLPQEAIELFETLENGTVTVRNLLSMRSGFHDYWDQWGAETGFNTFDYDATFTPMDLVKLGAATTNEIGLLAPDMETEYTNTNFILLGMILSNVTGVSTPGGLADLSAIVPEEITEFVFAETDEQWTGAHGYLPTNNASKNYVEGVWDTFRKFSITTAQTAGNVFLPARSIATWMYMLHTGQVVSPDSVAQMNEFQGDIDFPDAYEEDYDIVLSPYGLGSMDLRGRFILLQLGGLNDTRADAYKKLLAGGLNGHEGNYMGYKAWAGYAPEFDLSFGMAVNHQEEQYAEGEVLRSILDMVEEIP